MSKLSKFTRQFLAKRFPTLNHDAASALELNEALNLDYQVIFIAVPKTGTTSVRRQLGVPRNPLIPNPHLDIIQVRELIYPMLLRATLGTNHSFPTSETPSDADLRVRSEQLFAELFKFSAVRNPWARAVSLWSRKEGVEVSGGMSFEQFIEDHHHASDTCREPTLHQNQIDWLCDEDGRMIMDYVYKVEEFESAIAEIEERTEGRLRLESRQLNVNPRSASKRYRSMYSEHTRKLIAQRFERDIDHFEYVF